MSSLARHWTSVKLFRVTENCVLWRSLFGLLHCSWPDFSEPICTDGVLIIWVYQNILSGTQFVVFRVVTPCSLLITQFRRNRTTSNPENWGKVFHRNVLSTDNYMTSQPRKPYLNTTETSVSTDNYTTSQPRRPYLNTIETSVSTDNYMTSQPRRPYLNTRFFVNLDSYTILNSSIIFPGKKVSFP